MKRVPRKPNPRAKGDVPIPEGLLYLMQKRKNRIMKSIKETITNLPPKEQEALLNEIYSPKFIAPLQFSDEVYAEYDERYHDFFDEILIDSIEEKWKDVESVDLAFIDAEINKHLANYNLTNLIIRIKDFEVPPTKYQISTRYKL